MPIPIGSSGAHSSPTWGDVAVGGVYVTTAQVPGATSTPGTTVLVADWTSGTARSTAGPDATTTGTARGCAAGGLVNTREVRIAPHTPSQQSAQRKAGTRTNPSSADHPPL